MDITDEDIPQPRMLTEEESREMKENLAQRNFGMQPCGVHSSMEGWRVRRRPRAARKGYRPGNDDAEYWEERDGQRDC